MNPYEVLGVDRNANEKTIRSAYRRLARQWHPDSFQTEVEKENAEHKMKEISEAFDILKTPEKRRIFDAENPISENVYEYYANKKTKDKTKSSADIEKEKQRKAVLQFLDIEYQHKKEILDMFDELATGAINDAFSNEEYLEYLELVIAEQQDCITKIQKIIVVAKKKRINGLEAAFMKAQEVIDELIQKESTTPKTLEKAHYAEETRILTEKINELIGSFPTRIRDITSFNLLDKTWEFDNDKQLNSVRNEHKKQVMKLLKDIKWIQRTSSARNIAIGLIDTFDSQSPFGIERNTLDECKEIVEEFRQTLNLNLQELRDKFWKEKCEYSQNASGQIILDGFKSFIDAEEYKGTFICPPHINSVREDAFYWLKNVDSISISASLVNNDTEIGLPIGSLKNLIITFGESSQKVVIFPGIHYSEITRKGDYICISDSDLNVYSYKHFNFILVDAKGVYVYDEKRICELNGVTSMEKLRKCGYDSRWKGHQLQIHTWAQVTNRLPNPNLMKNLPVSIESAKEWISMNKASFEKVFLANDEKLKSRVIRLYVALGALNGRYCHAQAEWLISKLDISKMYRTRLERFPKEKQDIEDPIFSVPKSAVDLVQENIDNKEFLPYVFAFLEGYKLFKSEAKKANVELSPEFIISAAPQYIFHRKVDNTTAFVRQLLEIEKDINVKIADRILRFYTIVQRNLNNSIDKNIIETVDNYDSSKMHYKFFDIEELQSYIAFANDFRLKEQFQESNTHYGVEAENVFLSSNSHAIEIIDGENKRIAIVILNLLDEGELFADIMKCTNKSIKVLETIKRALTDQRDCNNLITGISIGMNEAPRSTKYNEWRKVIQDSNVDWIQEISWIKFEYLFKSYILGTSYKGYRARFMVDGKEQHLDSPNPWDNPRISRRRNPRYW